MQKVNSDWEDRGLRFVSDWCAVVESSLGEGNVLNAVVTVAAFADLIWP